MADKPPVKLALKSDTPDSVCRLIAALFELAHLEVPSLADYSGEHEMVLDATTLDHRFAKVWRETRDILTADFTPARGSESIIYTRNPDDCVRLSVTGEDEGVCEIRCMVEHYADGTRTVSATYSTKDDWEARVFGDEEWQERTFIEVGRNGTLTEEAIEASIATTPWWEQNGE